MMPAGDVSNASGAAPGRRLPSVTTQIFIGLVLGVLVGYVWPAFGIGVRPLADAFLRMIKMIVAPLLFSTLVVGIAGHGDEISAGSRQVGHRNQHRLLLAQHFHLVQDVVGGNAVAARRIHA